MVIYDQTNFPTRLYVKLICGHYKDIASAEDTVECNENIQSNYSTMIEASNDNYAK